MGQGRHLDLHQSAADELAPVFFIELEEVVPGVGGGGSRGDLCHARESTRGRRRRRARALATASLLLTVAAAALGAAAAELVPVPAPSLAGMEEIVQEQLRDGLAELESLKTRDDVAPDELAEAYGRLGQIYLAYDLKVPAEACLRNAAALSPGTFRWPYLLGAHYQQERRLDEAVARLEAALALDPRSAVALVRLGEVHLAGDRPAAAAAAFERALAVDPASASALAGLGKAASARSDFEAAVGFYEKALAIAPGASALRYPLAIALRELGRVDEARRHLRERGGAEVPFDDPLTRDLSELATGSGIRLMAGNRALRRGDLETAVASYRQALELNPRNAEAHRALGAALLEAGDGRGAIEHYRAALAIEPDHPRSRYNLATLLAEEGDLEAAVTEFAAALDLAPDDADARFNLAVAHLQLARRAAQEGRYADAVEHFDAVIRNRPEEPEPRFGRAMALLLAERYEEVRSGLEAAVRELPENPELAHLLARFLATCPDARLRDGERALEMALSIFRSRPRPDVAETVAMAYAELGRFEDAVSWQRRLIGEAQRAGAVAALPELRARLALYERGEPCRAPWLAR